MMLILLRVTISIKPNRGGICILQDLYSRAQTYTVLYNGKAKPQQKHCNHVSRTERMEKQAKMANKSHGGNKVNCFQLRLKQFLRPLLRQSSMGQWYNMNMFLFNPSLSRLFFLCNVSINLKEELLLYMSPARP